MRTAEKIVLLCRKAWRLVHRLYQEEFNKDVPNHWPGVTMKTRALASPAFTLSRIIVEDLVGDWSHLDERIENVTDEIEALACGDANCQQLMTVPGVGPNIASTMVAASATALPLQKGATLRRGSAWFRSRCLSTGDRTILGRITKRGNRYLRTLFMQGTRVSLLSPANWAKHDFGLWLKAAAQRLHHNVVATALDEKGAATDSEFERERAKEALTKLRTRLSKRVKCTPMTRE